MTINFDRSTAKLPELALMLDSDKYGELSREERERVYKAFSRLDAMLPTGGHSTVITGDTINYYTKFEIRLISGGKYNSYPFDESGLELAILESVSGDVIELPAGTLTIRSGITIKPGVSVRGVDRQKVVIYAKGNIKTLITLGAGSLLDNLTCSFTTSYIGTSTLAMIDQSMVTNCNLFMYNNTSGTGNIYLRAVADASGGGLYYETDAVISPMHNCFVYVESNSNTSTDGLFGCTISLNSQSDDTEIVIRDCQFAIKNDTGYGYMIGVGVDNYGGGEGRIRLENCISFVANYGAIDNLSYSYGFQVNGIDSVGGTELVDCYSYCYSPNAGRDQYAHWNALAFMYGCVGIAYADHAAGTSNQWGIAVTEGKLFNCYGRASGTTRAFGFIGYDTNYIYGGVFDGTNTDLYNEDATDPTYLYGVQYDSTGTDGGEFIHLPGDRAGLGTDQTFTGDNTFEGDLNVNYVDFDLTPTDAQAEGRLIWNPDENTLNLGMTGGVVNLQIGQEMLIRATNDEVDTITNGSVCYISGATGNNPLVKRADNSSIVTAIAVGVATEDIAAGQKGYITSRGLVHEINTIAVGAGSVIWLGTSGAFTGTRPTAPDYDLAIGQVIRQHVSEGIIIVNIVGIPKMSELSDVHNNQALADGDTYVYDGADQRFENVPTGRHINYYNGSLLETFRFLVVSNGSIITGAMSNGNDPGENLTARFSDGYTSIPEGAVNLTAGTVTVPQFQYVYIPIATKLLTVSTSDWPATEHIKIATVSVRTAALTATDGALMNANWNDHTGLTADSMGHSLHIGERLRQFFGSWSSGVEATLTITPGSPDNVEVAVTAGKVFQMHKQDFGAIDMGAGGDIHMVNHPATPYVTVTDLNLQLTDSAGGDMSGNYYTLIIWGVNNSSTEQDHIMCNLPGGSYNTETNALNDPSGWNDYTIPLAYKNTGFLIAQYTLKHSAAGGGTWTEVNYIDLRGVVPNASAGSATGASGITTFLGLTDTPAAYVAKSVPSTNITGTALENSALYVDNANDWVGVRVADPSAPLEVGGGEIRLWGTGVGGAADISQIAHYSSDGLTLRGFVGMASPINLAMYVYSADALYLDPDGDLYITAGGDVDIQAVAGGEVVFNNGSVDVDFRVESDNHAYALFVRGNDGVVSIGGTPTTAALLDILEGGLAITIGADDTLNTRTNNTAKYGRIGSAHYTNAEQPVGIVLAGSDASNNFLDFGGGTSVFNAATLHRFYTAANQITTTGIERFRITNSEVVVNDPGNDLDFRVESNLNTAALWVNGANSDVNSAVRLRADGFLSVGPISELTIAAGVITVTQTNHSVDTQDDDPTDDLNTINGGTIGDIIILKPANSARTVVLKDGADNLRLEGDCSLDTYADTITLIYDSSGTWLEVARANNG